MCASVYVVYVREKKEGTVAAAINRGKLINRRDYDFSLRGKRE